MNNKPNILVVDDAADSRLMLAALLEDDYTIIEADSGEACLKELEKDVPDLMLLDVTMPGISGYGVCAQLRKQTATARLPIIFVSALDTVEERLKGYEVGGNEYVTKPFDGGILREKVSGCLHEQQKLAKVQKEATSAMQVAMEAMTVSSELGQVIEFIKTLQELKTMDSVGEAVIKIAKDFSLDAVALINTDETLYVGCKHNSMEAHVLDRTITSKDRIISVGIRTVIRNNHIALLIKNMPADDENRYGRLKDHLAVLMDIADGHVIMLNTLLQVSKQRKVFLGNIISVAEEQIKKTSENLRQHEKKSKTIIQDMVSDLEGMLFGLGLEEDQEKKLMTLADGTSLKLQQSHHSTQNMDNEIGIILECLYEFMDKED